MSRPMHIVHTESSLGWGGQEIRILTEAAGMLKRGQQVTLLCPPQAKIYSEAQLRKIPVVALPIARKNLNGIRALRRWLKAHTVDVINSHSSTDSWIAALACRLMRKSPQIVRTRHISAAIPNNISTRWLYQHATRHIATTGELLREQLIRDNRFVAEKITSVPTGIDTEQFVPGDKTAARLSLGLDPTRKIIGIVATLRSWKGHRYLIEALAQMQDKTVQLLIVGDGPQHQALEKQVAALQLQDRVKLVGNQRNVVPWLQSLDIFVLPSYANEGVPQALLQAMLCGLPCVTTRAGSITEIARDQSTALLVDMQNVDSLKTALEKLLADPVHANKLGEAARTHVLQHYSLEHMLDKMQAIFDNAVENV